MALREKIEWSRELCKRAMMDFDPFAVIVAFTSGGDSNIALKLATMFLPVDFAFTCDTTIGSIETLVNCQKVVTEHYKLKYVVRRPTYGGVKENPDTYFELVKKHGFPGKTPTSHAWMYRYLKDHTVRSIQSYVRQRRVGKKILIISGARQDESTKRMGTSKDITIVDGKNIWLNICNNWTKQDCAEFEAEHGLKNLRSPISLAMGISGECWCGAWAPKNQHKELKIFSPSTHEKIIMIQKYLQEHTPWKWAWDESPPPGLKWEKQGQINMFTGVSMCSTCMNNPVAANYDDPNGERR